MTTSSPVGRFFVGTACFVIMVAGMKAAEALLVPFLLSLFIAVLCSPPLSWLKARGLPNGLAIALIMLIVLGVSLLVGSVVGAAIQDFRQDLPQYQSRLSQLMLTTLAQLNARGLALDAAQLRDSFDPSAILGFAGNALANLGNVMTNVFLILLTVVFILAEEVGFSDKIQLASRQPAATLRALNQFKSAINRYMAIKTLISLATGLLVTLWLWIIGVDYPVLWGLLAFLFNYIPTFGSFLAGVPPVLLALVQLGWPEALMVVAGFSLINVLLDNVLTPRLMGKGLDLSALVVFLSLVFWGWALGTIGMFLSVPLTMTVKIALESFDETRWVGVMLGSGRRAQARIPSRYT